MFGGERREDGWAMAETHASHEHFSGQSAMSLGGKEVRPRASAAARSTEHRERRGGPRRDIPKPPLSRRPLRRLFLIFTVAVFLSRFLLDTRGPMIAERFPESGPEGIPGELHT